MEEGAVSTSLKDFVRDALTDVVGGLLEAQAAVAGASGDAVHSALIAPNWRNVADPTHSAGHVVHTGQPVEVVEFDIAVTTGDTTRAGGGGGIQVVGVRIGAEADRTAEQSSVSRVKFRVPLALPTSDLEVERPMPRVYHEDEDWRR